MKNLKMFESYNKYHVGDYIYFTGGSPYDVYAKIIVDNSMSKYHIIYQIEAYNMDTNKIVTLWVTPDDIKRKLTKKEIDVFDLKSNVNKYNL